MLYRRNPICRTALQRILAGRASDWPPAAFYCPRFFFDERLPNARRSRARALLAPRTGRTVRGSVGVGVRVRVRVGVGWGLCRYLGQKCAKTSCNNSLQARPANRGSRYIGRSTNTEYYYSSDMLILIQHSKIKVGYSPLKKIRKKQLWDTRPRFQIGTLCHSNILYNYFQADSCEFYEFGVNTHLFTSAACWYL